MMYGTFLQLLLLHIICHVLKSETDSDYYRQNEPFTDIQVFDHRLWEKYAINNLHCTSFCVMPTDCRSISYNHLTRVCQGYSADFRIETVSSIPEYGWVHYDSKFSYVTVL